VRRLLVLSITVLALVGAGCSSSPSSPREGAKATTTRAPNATTSPSTPASAAELAETACAGVAGFYREWFGKNASEANQAAEDLSRDADGADHDNPSAFQQLATALQTWLVDVTAAGWVQSGQQGDAQTQAVATACSDLQNPSG
jgi:hypothetical protein